jgi:hypothetical protein
MYDDHNPPYYQTHRKQPPGRTKPRRNGQGQHGQVQWMAQRVKIRGLQLASSPAPQTLGRLDDLGLGRLEDRLRLIDIHAVLGI